MEEGLLYTQTHEWAKLEGDTAMVGITDYAQKQLGDVVFVELPQVGQELRQFESFGTIESTKAASDLYAPLSGKVLEVNEELNQHPEWVNQDPYLKGWMIKIEIRDKDEIKNLIKYQNYQTLIKEQG